MDTQYNTFDCGMYNGYNNVDNYYNEEESDSPYLNSYIMNSDGNYIIDDNNNDNLHDNNSLCIEPLNTNNQIRDKQFVQSTPNVQNVQIASDVQTESVTEIESEERSVSEKKIEEEEATVKEANEAKKVEKYNMEEVRKIEKSEEKDKEKEKETVKKDVRKKFIQKIFQTESVIENDLHENERIDQFRKLCREKSKEAFYFLYKNGYFFVGARFPKLLKERKESLAKRLTGLKRNRVTELWKYSGVGLYFLPNWKNLVIMLGRCKKPDDVLVKISLVLNYYLRPGDIYMYNPVDRAGYKYYSGESLIIYFVPENLHPTKKTRLKNAWNAKLANGKDITNVKKIVLCVDKNINWIQKDSKSDWCVKEFYDYHPITKQKLNFFENFFILWLGEQAFRTNFKKHCETRNIPLWTDC